MDLATCSLNSITVKEAPLPQLIALAAEHGFGGVGLWRDTYADAGVTKAGRRIQEAGLTVSSVCRGGMFPQPTAVLRAERLADNRRAVAEAHALDADCLVLVGGPAYDRDLAGARAQIADGIAELIPEAAAAGVRLAVEPFHPMMAADRSAITSFTEANDLVERLASPWVGLTLDSYHLWWDAALADQMRRAADTVMSVQLADWVLPIHGQLSSRGMPSEGCIDLAGFVQLAHDCGYRGLVEVEVLSDRWWATDPAEATRVAAAALQAMPAPTSARVSS
jgi:sugar phosphate isomerase/epimerase